MTTKTTMSRPLFAFFITFALLLQVSHAATSVTSSLNTSNPHCTEKRLQKVELAVAKMIGFGANGRHYPEKLSKVKAFCKETTRLVSQVESFIKECFRKEISDLTSVVLYSVKSSMVKQYCGKTKNSKRVANLVKVSPCLNKHFLPNDRCIVQFINETKPLVNIKEDSKKIPLTCCAYVRTLECFDRLIDTQSCLRHDRERILEIIRGLFTGVTDIMCGEYNESTDRCRTLGPAPEPTTPNKKNYVTFMFLLTDLLASTKSFAY